MLIEEVQSFEELVEYLKDWSNFGGDPAYDFNGALSLFLAILSNLVTNHNEGDLEVLKEFSPFLTTPQTQFVEKLLEI